MKVLFFHPNFQDYLSDSLFHGLRTLLGKNCIDVPKYDILYSSLRSENNLKLRGNGFSLYGLLEDEPDILKKRLLWKQEINDYDLIVISHIWQLWPMLWEYKGIFKNKKIAVLDGADIPSIFPFNSMIERIIKHPWSFFTSLKNVLYFKRELFDSYHSYSFDRILPAKLGINWALPDNIFPLSFSIPEEKITKVLFKQKTKYFVNHIVDGEVAQKIDGSFFSETGSDKLIFGSESEYYSDIQKSKYGITTKRAGWDCLRHYELAANGAVLCFRNLGMKPKKCAPHDLNFKNSIIYNNADELFHRINSINENEYNQYLDLTYQWIFSKTTKKVAEQFIQKCISYK